MTLAASIAFASQPLVQGEIDIADYSEQVENQSYRISGSFYDLSVVGFDGTDIAVSNLVFTEAINGDVDAWRITNIVAAGAVSVTVDVVYVESVSNTVGMVAGYAGVCSLSTNSVGFPQTPSPEFCHLSGNMLNQIRNYAFTRIQAGGGGSGFPLTNNASLGGFTLSDGTFSGEHVGNGAGLTNLSNTETLWPAVSNQVQSDLIAVNAATNALNTTATNQVSQISALQNSTGALNSALSAETSARIGADAALSNNVSTLNAASNALNNNKLNVSGGVMTGPLTNNVAFYGNGAGLTNTPAPSGVAYLGSNNTYSAGRTQIFDSAVCSNSMTWPAGARTFNLSVDGTANTHGYTGSGIYTQIEDNAGYPAWHSTNSLYIIFWTGTLSYAISCNLGGAYTNIQFIKSSPYDVPSGDYSGYPGGATATATESISYAASLTDKISLGISQITNNAVELKYGKNPLIRFFGDCVSFFRNLDFKGFAATNASLLQSSSLQITGGSPTNGAVWLCTNSATGAGKWSYPVSFRATLTTDFYFSNMVVRTVVWNNEVTDTHNCFNGTNFIAPVNGIYSFFFGWRSSLVAGTPYLTRGTIVVNGVDEGLVYQPVILNSFSFGVVSSGDIYLTNGAVVSATIRGDSVVTNRLDPSASTIFFSGSLLREIP